MAVFLPVVDTTVVESLALVALVVAAMEELADLDEVLAKQTLAAVEAAVAITAQTIPIIR